MKASPERAVAVVLAVVTVCAVALLIARGDGDGGGAGRDAESSRATPTPTAGREPGPSRVRAPRAFADTSFWNARLPDDLALERRSLDVGGRARPINPSVGAELQAYARRPDGSSNTFVSYEKYTSRVVVVGADQPLQPVKLCRFADDCVPPWATQLDQTMRGLDSAGRYAGGGLPIPRDVPLPDADDTDASIVLYQPAYRGPNGERGRLYEAWQFRRNPDYDRRRPVGPDNARYTAAWGGRMLDVDDGPGIYRDRVGTGDAPWGGPDAVGESRAWGATASGMPMIASQMSVADCARGRLDHGIGIEVPAARRGTTWWPAQRSDGYATDKVVSEGMRLTFERGTRPPPGLTPLARAVWQAAYDYGLVVDDQSASSLNFRAEPGCERTRLFRAAGVPAWEQMRGFPWSRLRVIAEGSDATPNPTR